MRKIVYIRPVNQIRKLMVFDSTDGVYVFVYDCLQDTYCTRDLCFDAIEEAEEHCEEVYGIIGEDWITITDPSDNCQHDFIRPTRIKNKEIYPPEITNFQSLINGNWVDLSNEENCLSFAGLTGNERLRVSGLQDEFQQALITDQAKAAKILQAVAFDRASMRKMIGE